MAIRISGKKNSSTDRRLRNRLPIEGEVRYRVFAQKEEVSHTGRGRMLDMSSSGARFTTESDLPTGARVELTVSWPAHLDNGTRLKLVLSGRVVRSGETQSAMSIGKYEFRTFGAGL